MPSFLRVLAPLLIAAIGVLALACGDSASESPPEGTTEVRIGDLVIRAELALTQPERSQGLSDRESMPQDRGMLFVFADDLVPGFSMRRMQFPLDFIWISADRRVVDVTQDVPPSAPGEELSGIQPSDPISYVLEVNAGVVQEWGIAVGDEVAFDPDISSVDAS